MTKEQKQNATKFLESLESSANEYNSEPSQKGTDWFHLNLGCYMGERVAAFFKKGE